MDSNKLNDWLQIVGLFGVIASLIFVGIQVRQTQVIAEGESAMLAIDTTLAARQMLIDNIEIWTRGCAGEELSASEQAMYAQLHRAFSESFFFGWLAARHNILDYNANDFVYKYAANVHRYPGFARQNIAWQEWAREGMNRSLESGRVFVDAVMTRLEELREIEPEPSYDIQHCGM